MHNRQIVNITSRADFCYNAPFSYLRSTFHFLSAREAVIALQPIKLPVSWSSLSSSIPIRGWKSHVSQQSPFMKPERSEVRWAAAGVICSPRGGSRTLAYPLDGGSCILFIYYFFFYNFTLIYRRGFHIRVWRPHWEGGGGSPKSRGKEQNPLYFLLSIAPPCEDPEIGGKALKASFRGLKGCKVVERGRKKKERRQGSRRKWWRLWQRGRGDRVPPDDQKVARNVSRPWIEWSHGNLRAVRWRLVGKSIDVRSWRL